MSWYLRPIEYRSYLESSTYPSRIWRYVIGKEWSDSYGFVAYREWFVFCWTTDGNEQRLAYNNSKVTRQKTRTRATCCTRLSSFNSSSLRNEQKSKSRTCWTIKELRSAFYTSHITDGSFFVCQQERAQSIFLRCRCTANNLSSDVRNSNGR